MNQFDNAGQVCLAGTRLLVEASMRDAFLERFVAAAAAIVQGDPREEATDIGPLITREHFERVDGFVQRAKADGAEVVFGGGPNEELGRPLLPARRCSRTRPAGSEILTQEVFGPVLTLQTFEDEDEAVALANDTEYGLAAIVYTGDEARAERVSDRARRRHRLGELLLRARPGGAVRRRAQLRDRPRGRRLELRLLRGREERLHGTVVARPRHREERRHG